MGGAPRDDGTEALSGFADAQGRFDDDLARLARTPRGFAAGFVAARRRLLAPLEEAELRGAQPPGARGQVEAQILAALGDPALAAILERDPAGDLRWRQLRRDMQDAGAGLDAAARQSIAALEAGLHEAAAAYREYVAAGPRASDVRARLRDEPAASVRETLWAEYHRHLGGAAGSCLDLLRLRRARARVIGFASYAAWIDRDAAFQIDSWLAPMVRAAAVRARACGRPAAAWDQHRPSPMAPSTCIDRDVAVARLCEILGRAGVEVEFDVVSSPAKRGAAWTSRGVVTASLPDRIDEWGVRVLLHESGHAAEAALSPRDIRAPTDTAELSSTLLEPLAWSVPMLRTLGAQQTDVARLETSGRHRLGWPALAQLALASADRALHETFDPDADGSPLPFAQRIYARVEGQPRDPRDATVATHRHLFGRPHGYAARYACYPLGDALAQHVFAQRPRDLANLLPALGRTLWTEAGRADPAGAIGRLAGTRATPAAFVRAALGARGPSVVIRP